MAAPMSSAVASRASPSRRSSSPRGPSSRRNSGPERPEQLVKGDWFHGRYYGTWRKGKYLFPIDSEELNRLDIFHKFFLVARDDKTHEFELRKDRVPKILDLGTGTAIWAVHITEELKAAEMMTVDINQIQPPLIPRGMTTIRFDLEEPTWTPLLWDCDLIHVRLLFGSLSNGIWPRFYRNAFDHLSPGHGYIEQTEIDWTPHWSGPDRPESSALQEWSDRFLGGMDRANRSARVDSERTKRLLKEAGFIDIKEEKIRCYVNPWSQDNLEREIARWFNLGICQGLEAMSLMPMITHGNLDEERVKELCDRTRQEMCVLRYRAYMTLHCWTARRASTSRNGS